jgi:hypothetical protein
MIKNEEVRFPFSTFPFSTFLVYDSPSGTLRKFQDEESFSEQGITHPTTRVYILPRYRATGSHDPDEISPEEQLQYRHVIRRGKDAEVEYERFYGG